MVEVQNKNTCFWRLPMGLALNNPFYFRIFHDKSSIVDYIFIPYMKWKNKKSSKPPTRY
jgi:hypothetical protein